MRPWHPFRSFFLLFFASILCSVAFAQSAQATAPPPPLLLSPPPPSPESEDLASVVSPSPGARSHLSTAPESSDVDLGKILLASSDGDLHFMDPKSLKFEWRISTGGKLLEQWSNTTDHFCFFGEDWSLYEYDKDTGITKLDLTIEESIHKLTKIDGRTATVGSVSTNLIYVDERTGRVLLKYTLPLMDDTGPVVDEKVTQEVRDGSRNGNIITIVRKDYMLKSVSLGETLWSLRAAHFTAHMSNYENWMLPNSGNAPALFPLLEEKVPVYSMPEIGGLVGANGYPMLPPGSVPADPLTVNITSEKQGPHLVLSKFCETGNTCLWKQVGSSILSNTSQLADCGPFGGSVASASQFGNVSNVPQFLLPQKQVHPWPYKRAESSPSRSDHVAKNFGVMLKVLALLFIIPILVLCRSLYLKLKRAEVEKQSIELKFKKTVVSKKKKGRKSVNSKVGAPSTNQNIPNLSENDKTDTNDQSQLKFNEKDLFLHLVRDSDASDGRWVGRLFVLNSEIGKGSNGTVVLEGVYDGRPVAVKRLLRAHHEIALKEIQNLIASDRHPNIVRWYGVEQDIDFVYISLERCLCSLGDLIQVCSDSPPHPNICKIPSSSYINEHEVRLGFPQSISKDLQLWKEDGFPSFHLLKLMRDVVSGLAHLHELGIIHRDLKPQNVLISSDKFLKAKLSDMGISKRLPENMSSLSHHATGYGSSGWQAPEQLLHGRQTRAVDLFSLGCILFFCITKGKHPFGNYFERDSNILKNKVDLFLVDHIPEAVHLLSQLLDSNPDKRPSAVAVFRHPLFWNSEMRLSFLRDVSDRVELEDRENGSGLLQELQQAGPVAFGGKWGEKLDAAFITDMGRYRKYNFEFTRDLLRVIRNKLNHYREIPKALQEILGPVPEGFDTYFSKRFPNLLIEVYKVVYRFCREEDGFRKYFQSSIF